MANISIGIRWEEQKKEKKKKEKNIFKNPISILTLSLPESNWRRKDLLNSQKNNNKKKAVRVVFSVNFVYNKFGTKI